MREAPDHRARGRSPAVARLLAAWLVLAPLLQGLSLAGLRVANFAPDRPWNYLAYGLAAPYVAWLVWRRQPRARFAAYVFLTHEAARGVHFRRWDTVAVAGLFILLLQLPAARWWLLSLNAAEMRARWRRRWSGDPDGHTRVTVSRDATADPPAPEARRRGDTS